MTPWNWLYNHPWKINNLQYNQYTLHYERRQAIQKANKHQRHIIYMIDDTAKGAQNRVKIKKIRVIPCILGSQHYHYLIWF